MKYKTVVLSGPAIPQGLQQIPQPPAKLFVQGGNLSTLLDGPKIAIVGSRTPTAYGAAITQSLASELSGLGITIISGLALGIDSIAHRAALAAAQPTIAVLPVGLDNVYPRSHVNLANQILQNGALVSEVEGDVAPQAYQFIARNRLIAGLADAVLITEAAEKSGSLHTARFAMEQGKPVLAVPGPITSGLSKGTNNLIKSGATPITSVDDVLFALGLTRKSAPRAMAQNPEEAIILQLLNEGLSDGRLLQEKSSLTPELFSQTLTYLEIDGRVKPLGNNQWIAL